MSGYDTLAVMGKRINKYWDICKNVYDFMEVFGAYRKEKAIVFFRKQITREILETGCGYRPLFLNYKQSEAYTVVGPSRNNT